MTAVDSSALIAIYKGEDLGEAWVERLVSLRREGRLVVCEVVLAELSSLFAASKQAIEFLNDLGVEFEPINIPAALLAGEIFKVYRRSGGPRDHLLPDFLIAAHAQTQARQLAASDRGYLRRYFPKLKVIAPR